MRTLIFTVIAMLPALTLGQPPRQVLEALERLYDNAVQSPRYTTWQADQDLEKVLDHIERLEAAEETYSKAAQAWAEEMSKVYRLPLDVRVEQCLLTLSEITSITDVGGDVKIPNRCWKEWEQ